MIPYVLLIFVPIIFNYVMIAERQEKLSLKIGKSQFVRSNSLALPMFFLIFILLLMLRDETIGRDLLVYKNHFNYYRQVESWGNEVYQIEALFKVLNWFVGQITSNYQWFLVIVALITVLPVAGVYCEDRTHSYLKIILFVNLSTFIMIFSGLRQAIAMAIGMLAYRWVRKKKLIPFLIAVLVALGFHHSAFFLVFMYPLYHVSFHRKHLFILIPVMVSIFLFNQPIFGVLTNVLARYSDEYSNITMTFTGAYGSLLLFILYTIFAYVIPDENLMDAEIIGLRNFMILIVCVQFFAPLHTIAMRMNYYYLMFIPILIGKVLNVPQSRYRQVAKFAEIILIIFFTFVFLRSTYISSVTGISTLDTVPYNPFWR